jgi:hypothetical protein
MEKDWRWIKANGRSTNLRLNLRFWAKPTTVLPPLLEPVDCGLKPDTGGGRRKSGWEQLERIVLIFHLGRMNEKSSGAFLALGRPKDRRINIQPGGIMTARLNNDNQLRGQWWSSRPLMWPDMQIFS